MKTIHGELLDISFSNGRCYMLKEFHLSLEWVEKNVREFPTYLKGFDRDPAVEKANLPPIVYVFYKEIFESQRLLSPDELFLKYVDIFFETKDKDLLQERSYPAFYTRSGLMGRFMRTYPSLLRDFYLYLLLENARCFEKVVYSVNKDYFDKTDLTLHHHGHVVALNILLDSANAIKYRNQKEYRQGKTPEPSKLQIDLVIKEDLRRPVNNFYLPKQKCVDLVMEKFDHLIQSFT